MRTGRVRFHIRFHILPIIIVSKGIILKELVSENKNKEETTFVDISEKLKESTK